MTRSSISIVIKANQTYKDEVTRLHSAERGLAAYTSLNAIHDLLVQLLRVNREYVLRWSPLITGCLYMEATFEHHTESIENDLTHIKEDMTFAYGKKYDQEWLAYAKGELYLRYHEAGVLIEQRVYEMLLIPVDPLADAKYIARMFRAVQQNLPSVLRQRVDRAANEQERTYDVLIDTVLPEVISVRWLIYMYG